jgi:cardiolipin synthase A/B
MRLSSIAFEMQKLLDAIAAVVCLISPEKVKSIAAGIRKTEPTKAAHVLINLVGTPTAATVIEVLTNEWQVTQVGADELASMLLAASHVFTKTSSEQSVELVWTGPTTPFVSARRTEQALLQVINSSSSTLFITSFVAYDVSSIVMALNAATDRGVIVSMLLESSQSHGGNISFDVISSMQDLVPSTKLYAWRDKEDFFQGGSVHAKIAVADCNTCFITSANLTGHAMEKNMEAGVLISGGRVPVLLEEHLRSLVDTKVVALV